MNRDASARLSILGCRGIPSKYGGFETFAQRLALYLTEKGWLVTVYCQDSEGKEIYETVWEDIRLIHIPAPDYGALSSVLFDWKSVSHASETITQEKSEREKSEREKSEREKSEREKSEREKSESKDSHPHLILTLGYNTAVFCLQYRLKNLINIINMDGIEWRRQKWKLPQKIWLYLNEWCGSWLGNHLVADHPEIKNHLTTRAREDKITVIPYGAPQVNSGDLSLLDKYNLKPNEYAIIIARPEPENNILEIVSAFSRQKRDLKLVVLGNYKPDESPYHKQVMETASEEVLFIGAVYEPEVTNALRFYSKLYIHGHSVGGTNPSLVEALACGSAVLAHDNLFNRWVAGDKAHYFKDEAQCFEEMELLFTDEKEINLMKQASFQRHQEEFYATRDVEAYRQLFEKFIE
jgi:glycosyltransferase involved in cell wall biosynthesis